MRGNCWFIVWPRSIAAIAMGLRQVMGLYMKPITMDLGIGRQSFSLAIAIANIVWGVAAPFVGAYLGQVRRRAGGCHGRRDNGDRPLSHLQRDERDRAYTLPVFFSDLGLRERASMPWSVRRRAPRLSELRTQAIATLGMGSGLGILIALPYTHILIENLGWKGSLLALLATSLLILPLAYFISGKPVARGATEVSQSLGEALE